MAPLLEMTGIAKSFGAVPALARAELSIGAGEVHGLVGQNGAGKSTLIKILTGVHGKDEGRIVFAGRETSFASPREAQAGGIATIYQELNLVPLRSVTENVILGYEPKTWWGGIDWREAHRRTRAILERFGIDIDVRAPLGRYPTAIQQLVAIARAVSLEAKLVIMDEPTSSLDEREVEILFGVIRELKASGTSVLYVSHFLDELFEIADRVTIMRDGRTVGVHRMADVGKLDIIAAMLGRGVAEIEAAGMTGLAATGEASGEVLLEARGAATGRRLRHLDLTLRRGEIVGLAGLLGSGRTEAARAVFGLDGLTKGAVTVAGAGAIDGPRRAIAAGIGYLTEDRKAEGIVPDLSVRENLTLALLPKLCRAGIIDTAAQRAIVERFVAGLGIKAASIDQPIRELSGGNQQKVLLGRWLAIEPKILLLDEPTRGVDVGAKLEIQTIIRRTVEAGAAVLLISSEFEELIEGADEIVVLQDGRTVSRLRNPGVTEDALVHAIAHHAEPDEARP